MISGLTATSTTDTQSSATKNLNSQYSTFLNLLTAQVRNQDPLSPMDTTEWTNQLVQYSSVEQQIKSNTYLAQMASNSSPGMSSAVDYIGKTITADQTSSVLSGGAANWAYSLSGAAATATATITDSDGSVVWNGSVGDLSAGEHSFTWDGKSFSGASLPDGVYKMALSARDAAGNAITTGVGLTGKVTAAELSDGEVVLMLGKTPVPLSAVLRVAPTS